MRIATLALVALLVIGVTVGCSQQRANAPAVKDNVENALKQGGLNNINVDEDRDKGVITLKGDVQSEDQKKQAESLAQNAAPGRVVANELALRPAGMEDTARKVESNTDDAIKDHFKAVVAANHWENQHIRSEVKNGVLTLKGDVDTPQQRSAVEKTAAAIPGVQQVVNELDVKGAKNRKPAAANGGQ
jgi:hyperosmotically inducible periplasmic protein